MKRVLVAGGAGYIGSACTEYLLDRGYEVVVFDSLVTGHRAAVDKRAEFIEGDLADRDLIIDVVKNGNFDGIMHFAAFSLVGESMTDPGKYFRNNLGAGLTYDVRKPELTGHLRYSTAIGRHHSDVRPALDQRLG